MMKINLQNVEKKVLYILMENFHDDEEPLVILRYEGNSSFGNLTIEVQDSNDYIKSLKRIINCLEDVDKGRA